MTIKMTPIPYINLFPNIRIWMRLSSEEESQIYSNHLRNLHLIRESIVSDCNNINAVTFAQ